MIEARHLTKHYRDTAAVTDLSFTVKPGRVTGFLGPNGAGKTTTLRLALGLTAPTSGQIRINGQPYADLRHPLREVGALLDATAVNSGLTAANHLRWLAASNRLPASRIEAVLDQAGLTTAAGKRVGTFSLGMKQRLGVAAAMLGDPQTLIFDEPVNGLDPDGIRWIRGLIRTLAGQGRTVLLSSHLISEMALTADHLLIIGAGRLIADTGITALLATTGHDRLETAYFHLTDTATEYRGVTEGTS